MKDPVFPEWQGRDLDGILGACLDLLEDTRFPSTRRWKEAGGRIVGHFQVYFPEEIAHAAGLLPFKVRGAPIQASQADSRFGSYLCSIVKSSLELALSKRVDLDLFVTHPICDAARNLAAIWGRNVSYPCQILYLPQNAASPSAAGYLRGEYDRLRRTLEEVSGTRVGDDALRRSIAVFNENRRLLRALYAVKRETPWLVAAHEAYALVAVGGLIPREEHNALLAAVLPLLARRPRHAQDRIRVVFEGGFCEQPPIDLIRSIGRSCYVVDDDFLVGMRWIVSDVPAGEDPLGELARAYLEHSTYSPVQHDPRKPKERMLADRVAGAGAGAVIVAAAKMCEPGLEEQVSYVHALDSARVPHFVTEFEENMTTFEQLEIQLETFVENLMFD